MRLSFSIQGDAIVAAIEVGTLSYKQTRAYQAERVAALTREVIAALARSNRAHTLSDNNLHQLEAAGGELFELLIPDGVARRLDGTERSIYLQLDELLVPVPWELLHDGEAFLCQRFEIGRAVATPQSIVGRSATLPTIGALQMLIVCANPRNDLPQVVSEGEQLLARLDASQAIEAHLIVDPTIDVVRRRLRDHDLVHFAGHAEHDPLDPGRGGWVLRDGLLTAGDIINLGRGRRLPLLVFSNACRSSQTEAWRGDERGKVYGLANAFLLAGVRLYLGTQWEVVDGQSAEFALAFYEALGRGASAGTAVHVARREVIERLGMHALGWASYVLYGDPSFAAINQLAPQTPPPTASQLQARSEAPWKRRVRAERRTGQSPLATTASASSSGTWGLGERKNAGRVTGTPEKPARRSMRWVLLGGGMLAVAAVVITLWILRARTDPHEGLGRPLEPGKAGVIVPRTAVLLEGPRARCVSGALRKARHFRLVDEDRVEQLLAAHQLQLSKPLSAALVARLGQELGAELVAFLSAGNELAVVDVLSSEVPVRQVMGKDADADCQALVASLQRVVHGQGKVTGRAGGSFTVNLGWRSRIAPGVELELLRGGKVVGRLRVEAVEMDQCRGTGPAQVGDEARLPR